MEERSRYKLLVVGGVAIPILYALKSIFMDGSFNDSNIGLNVFALIIGAVFVYKGLKGIKAT